MKNVLCMIAGFTGAVITRLFGCWNAALTTLVIFMGIDYISGLIVAGVFKNSNKTENGGIESRAGWKGLFKKGVTLAIVVVAYRLDLLIGTGYIKNAVVIAFTVNECISITENAVLMGIPIPKRMACAIEILKGKKDDNHGN